MSSLGEDQHRICNFSLLFFFFKWYLCLYSFPRLHLLIWYTEWILCTPLSQLNLVKPFQRWHFKQTISLTDSGPLHSRKVGGSYVLQLFQDFHVNSCSGNSFLGALYESERGSFILFIYCEQETVAWKVWCISLFRMSMVWWFIQCQQMAHDLCC